MCCERSTSWPKSAPKRCPKKCNQSPAQPSTRPARSCRAGATHRLQRRRSSSSCDTLVAGSERASRRRRHVFAKSFSCRDAGVPTSKARPNRRRRSPAASTTTPAPYSKPRSTTCQTSAASAAAAVTITWPSSTPTSNCPASAPRSASIACSPRWKSSACSPSRSTPAQVFIPYFDATHLGDYFRLAAELRAAGLDVEVYPEPAKLGKQLQYADRKGFRVAVIAGEREFAAGRVPDQESVDNAKARRSPSNATAVIAEIQRILAK